MAPIQKPEQAQLEQKIQDVIQSFYQLMVQVVAYDSSNRSSRDVIAQELATLTTTLREVLDLAQGAPLPMLPPELIQYVENGRNPDIYTREFVELVRRGNQLLRGKQHAFADLRDVLADQISSALPELRGDVARIVAATEGPGTQSRDSNAAAAAGATG